MTLAFPSLTADTAPDAARPILAASERRFGFLPSPVARAAHSPELLAHMLAGFASFDRTTLSHVEREVVAMTVGYEVGCHYCVAMHSATGVTDPTVAPHVAALRAGVPLTDPKLEALRVFARELVRTHGRVAADVQAHFIAAGYDLRAALDVTLGVSVYVLSTFTNVLTQAPLDPPFAGFAWQPSHRSDP